MLTKQTIEALKLANSVVFVVVLLAFVVGPLEGRVCTRVRSEKGVKTVYYIGECQQSFKAKCGWFTFQECTFNETAACAKSRNITVTQYRIVEDCCPGYHRNKGGKCVPLSEKEEWEETTSSIIEGTSDVFNSSDPDLDDLETVGLNVTSQGGRGKVEDGGGRSGGEDSSPSGDERVTSGSGEHQQVDSGPSSHQNGDDDDDDNFFLGISHGAYAGIVCGILFVACIALLTALHYRKRRLQDQKKGSVPADQEAAQRQQMIALEKMDSPATVAT